MRKVRDRTIADITQEASNKENRLMRRRVVRFLIGGSLAADFSLVLLGASKLDNVNIGLLAIFAIAIPFLVAELSIDAVYADTRYESEIDSCFLSILRFVGVLFSVAGYTYYFFCLNLYVGWIFTGSSLVAGFIMVNALVGLIPKTLG